VLTVLSHVGGIERLGLPPELAEQVTVVPIPTEGDLPAGVTGEVLISQPKATPNVAHVLTRGVRWVHLIGTGIDQFPLDVIGPDLVLTNSRGISAIPISEWVMACLLAVEKRLPDAWVDEPPATWNFPPEPLGTLHERVVGIVGFGAIGVALAERLLPFGARVRAMRRSDRPSPVPAVELVPTIDELVDGADHVVLVAPLTEATRGLVDARVLGRMKSGAHLVNVARGPMVVDADLRAALDRGHLGWASIDAPDPEPLPAGHWMYAHPRVHLSAHVSWNWPDAGVGLYGPFRENLVRYLAGRPLENVIDPAVGY
jgi:phosphoglycerate dehydrogenase-like enzyme